MDNLKNCPHAPLAAVPTGLTIPILVLAIVDTSSGHVHEVFTLLGLLSPKEGCYPQIVADLSTIGRVIVTSGQLADSDLSPKSKLVTPAEVTGLAQRVLADLVT